MLPYAWRECFSPASPGRAHNRSELLQKQTPFTNTSLAKWLVPYVIIASLQYQFTKDGLSYASPFVLMTFRYVFTGLIFYFLGGRKIPLDRDALLVAAFSSASTLPWAIGLGYVSAGDSAILSYTMPLFSIPLAFFAIREKVSSHELLGALVGFSGVVVYSLTLSHGSQPLGVFFTLIGAVFWGAYSVYYRKLRNRNPLPILTTQFLVGSIPGAVGSRSISDFARSQPLGRCLLHRPLQRRGHVCPLERAPEARARRPDYNIGLRRARNDDPH